MRAILSKIVTPTCTPLAVAAAFALGVVVAGWPDAPLWWGIAAAVAVGFTYGVLKEVLRRVVNHRRETT